MSTSRRLGRRQLLAGITGTSVAFGGLVGGTFAAFSDTETASESLTSDVWYSCRAVYTNSAALESVTNSGSVTTYGVSDADVLGPVETGFSGSSYHVPVVDGTDALLLVGADGTETAFDVGSTKTPRDSKSLLAVATWNDDPLSVYYPGSNASTLYRVAPGGAAEAISQPGDSIKGALGAGDLDGDGTAEFAFIDGSGTVQYISPSGDDDTQDITSTGTSPGSNNNFGVGSPVQISGYGVVIPAVNGSGGVGLLGANGWVEKSLTTGSTAKKTPVYGCDFDGDDSVEVLFVGYSNGHLKYLDDVGGSNTIESVTDSADDPISVDSARGIR